MELITRRTNPHQQENNTASVTDLIRWKVLFYDRQSSTINTFQDIKSKKFLPRMEDLENFEMNILKLITRIKLP